MRNGFLLFILIVAALPIMAQTQLRGKVMDSKSDQPLDGATIFNTTEGIFRKAGQNGAFLIRAQENDVIIVSSAGYKPDTVKLSNDIIITGLFIGLSPRTVSLDTVTVNERTYFEDSLARRIEYAHFLDRPTKDLRGGNRPQSGFGVSVSPITYFSHSEKDKRQFKKRFNEYEREAYIDYYFSPSYVHRLTGLQGDELQQYMKKYRPSYSFLRNAQPGDLVLYINDTLKKFKSK
jgi:hypothetical protein